MHTPAFPAALRLARQVMLALEGMESNGTNTMKNLCIDVGGTRIKAAIIQSISTLEAIQAIPKIAIGSLGWLNRSLPEIVSSDNWASIVNQIDDKFDNIAICVPGPVENGRFRRNDLDVPEKLLDKFNKISPKPVSILEKDADAWTSGACHYLKLTKNPIHYPAIALAFGTGIGLSMASDEKIIYSIEISQWAHGFSHLQKAAGKSFSEPWKVHHILGLNYFTWVKENKMHWDYERIRREFTKRLIALMLDIEPTLSKHVGKVRTLIIGGGNSQYVSLHGLNHKIPIKIESLWDRKISIDPDIIPLIGLYQLEKTPNMKIQSERL